METNTPGQNNGKELLGQELADQLEKERLEAEEAKRQAANKKAAEDARKKKKIVLYNTQGKEVDNLDYFFSKNEEDTAPSYFNDVCGKPVDREDMLAVFNKIFKPKHGILFYKTLDKEVYIVIVPIKHSSTVGVEHNSIDGEFQKHAISFINEGSVNLDTLKTKLTKVSSTIKIADE